MVLVLVLGPEAVVLVDLVDLVDLAAEVDLDLVVMVELVLVVLVVGSEAVVLLEVLVDLDLMVVLEDLEGFLEGLVLEEGLHKVGKKYGLLVDKHRGFDQSLLLLDHT